MWVDISIDTIFDNQGPVLLTGEAKRRTHRVRSISFMIINTVEVVGGRVDVVGVVDVVNGSTPPPLMCSQFQLGIFHIVAKIINMEHGIRQSKKRINSEF